MLDKKSNNNDTYKLNDETKLKVTNVKRETDNGAIVYDVSVTLSHKEKSLQPLVFGSVDEISDYVNNIELEDQQLSLPM